MKLLDTMLIVYARTPGSPFNAWAAEQIAELVQPGGEGAGLSAVSLAELCAEDGADAAQVRLGILGLGVELLPVPVESAEPCGLAYRKYRHKRKAESGKGAPRMPLADFFIGAHAQAAGWELVTNDPDRFRTYFPAVRLVTP